MATEGTVLGTGEGALEQQRGEPAGDNQSASFAAAFPLAGAELVAAGAV